MFGTKLENLWFVENMMPLEIKEYTPIFRQACENLRGQAYCTDKVIKGLMAVSSHETCFSACPPFLGANNFGAIQCNHVADKQGKCGAGCIPARDTSPKDDGTSVGYLGCFEAKSTIDEGVGRFVKLMTVDRPGIGKALETGSANAIAQAMRDARYYEGFGKNQAERVNNYAVAIDRNAKLIANRTQEANPIRYDAPISGEVTGAAGGFTVAVLIAELVRRLTKSSDLP